MKNNLVSLIIVAVIVGGGGFFAGMKYQQTQVSGSRQFSTNGQGFQRGQGGQFFRNGGQGTRPVLGEVIASDSGSITIKMQDGSSKIVLVNDKTSINQAMKASASDLKNGIQVAAFGTQNSDGSITAQNIQINPQLQMRAGGKQPNTAPKSPEAKEIVVEGSNYKFSPNKITVQKGQKTRIVFKNTGGFHDFVVDELKISTAVIGSGQEDFVEFTPDKTGTYQFYCSVANHRQMGMVGTLVVQ